MVWVRPGKEFAALFRDFQHNVWRWECQGTYREPSEREPFRRWREGDPDPTYLDSWVERVRQFRTEGKTFQRVRMVTSPPTDYLRWQFDVTAKNIAGGEDIRWIDEDEAAALGAPAHDFYIFDDRLVAIMAFDENGVAGAEVRHDDATLAEHRRWRDLIWPRATPHDQSAHATTRST